MRVPLLSQKSANCRPHKREEREVSYYVLLGKANQFLLHDNNEPRNRERKRRERKGQPLLLLPARQITWHFQENKI